MDISQIVTELKKLIQKENFHIEPETSKRKYNMTTYEFVDLKKDITNINEVERWGWLDTLETYCFFGGIVEGIND